MATKTKTEKFFAVNVLYQIKQEDIESLIISAFEGGGSNYWYMVEKRINNTMDKGKDLYQTVLDGEGLIVSNGADTPKGSKGYTQKPLNIASIKKGIEIMANYHPIHFGNLLGDNADSETGDVFLQCCLFGEVIYG